MKLLIYHVDINLMVTASSFNVGTTLNMVRNIMREKVEHAPEGVDQPPTRTIDPNPIVVPTVGV